MAITYGDWKSARSAGVLLHPTSLPSPYGIGHLGPSAYGSDRLFVHIRLDKDPDNLKVQALERAGQPVVTLTLREDNPSYYAIFEGQKAWQELTSTDG